MNYSPKKLELRQEEPTKLVVIVGETASGKTDLAIELAKRHNGEIISADSWAVYKDFDIGTAKPDDAEQKQAKFHLIDVAKPKEGFNAALFKRLAVEAITDVASRGKLPILAGGTGLYIDSILYDYSFLPTNPALREELNRLSLNELVERANKMGLDLSGIDQRNKRRVIRLIENNGVKPTKSKLRSNTLVIGIKRPLDELKSRVERRIESMVERGFAEEVKMVGNKYGWDIEPMRAPGYRAFAEYIQGYITLETAKERFRQNDMQLAKKQRTWFKRNKSIHWLTNHQQAQELVQKFLFKNNT